MHYKSELKSLHIISSTYFVGLVVFLKVKSSGDLECGLCSLYDDLLYQPFTITPDNYKKLINLLNVITTLSLRFYIMFTPIVTWRHL